jgi:oligopeptide/dipeptide ABC transporter ATP-binding protein
MSCPLLRIEDLNVAFATRRGPVHAVRGVSLDVAAGETLALVGESGSGKSVSMMSVLGLTRGASTTLSGRARFGDVDLLAADEAALQRVRGAEISMIFQDPMTSLHPVKRIGAQIVEQIQTHEDVGDEDAMERAVELLAQLGVPQPRVRARAFPFELSGGMRQRVMIAMAMSCQPKLIIADEPTTALDVTVQAQILEQLRLLQEATGVGIVLITHDLGVVSGYADRVAVMYAGQIVERGGAAEMLADPCHPYTRALLESVVGIRGARSRRLPAIKGRPPLPGESFEGCRFAARCAHVHDACSSEPPLEPVLGTTRLSRCWIAEDIGRAPVRRAVVVDGLTTVEADRPNVEPPLLSVEHLSVAFGRDGGRFRRQSPRVHAVNDVTFSVAAGETLGLVGESGCGKSTLLRALVGLVEPSEGTVSVEGRALNAMSGRELRSLRKDLRIVFQDPLASLNPRRRIGDIIATPLRMHASDVDTNARVVEMLDRVGLGEQYVNRYPHELSGGQRQRVGIARAVVTHPRLVLLDEPVSALDVSIQSQILNLLAELQETLRLSYLFVAHDLAAVRHASQRVAVMYLGKIVELGATDDLFERPIHPYTAGLIAAAPEVDSGRRRAGAVPKGEPPNPLHAPSGCVFRTRCPRATEECQVAEPPVRTFARGHLAACHHPLSVDETEAAAAERHSSSPRAAV